MCEKNSILVEDNTFNVELESLDATLENTFMEIDSCQDRFEQIPNVQEEIKKQLQLSLGKIMLKLSAEFNVTETAINFLTSSLLCALKQDEQGKISDVIESFGKLSTTHKRKTFYTKYFNYNNPDEVFINFIERPMRNRNGCYVPKQIKKTLQYISLRKTLTALFSNDLFYNTFFQRNRHRTDSSEVTGIVIILPAMNFFKDTPLLLDYRDFLMM